nr:hypothetical protein CFP56_38056 [Quercus suber]
MIPPLKEEMDKRMEMCRVTRWWRASVRSSKFDCVRLEVLAKEEADLAMASRYLVATTVRALSFGVLLDEDEDGFFGFEGGFAFMVICFCRRRG